MREAMTFAGSGAPISTRLLGAYRRTCYVAAGAEVRIGERSAALDAVLRGLSARRGGFVTAWNPRSRRMPQGWNRRMQTALARHAGRLPAICGTGTAGRWSEEHLLVAADPRRLVVLARRFRQSAIVIVRRGRPAELRLLAADVTADGPASQRARRPAP